MANLVFIKIQFLLVHRKKTIKMLPTQKKLFRVCFAFLFHSILSMSLCLFLLLFSEKERLEWLKNGRVSRTNQLNQEECELFVFL